MLHSEVTLLPPQHNPKCKRCWPQKHILTWAQKGGEMIKKGRDQPATILKKRQWGKKMIYCFSIRRCLSLKGLRTKRQGLLSCLPHRVSFQSSESQSSEGLRTEPPLASRPGQGRMAPLPPPGHAATANTHKPKSAPASHKLCPIRFCTFHHLTFQIPCLPEIID